MRGIFFIWMKSNQVPFLVSFLELAGFGWKAEKTFSIASLQS